jgi:hypothetical protein
MTPEPLSKEEIEALPVDGHDADDAWLILFCLKCGRFMAADRLPDIDPPLATLMVMPCDSRACEEEGVTPDYYDANGRELGPDDWPEALGVAARSALKEPAGEPEAKKEGT